MLKGIFARPPTNTRVFLISGRIYNWRYPLPSLGTSISGTLNMLIRNFVNYWTFFNLQNWLADKNKLFPCLFRRVIWMFSGVIFCSGGYMLFRGVICCSGGLFAVQGGYTLFRGVICCSEGLYWFSGRLYTVQEGYLLFSWVIVCCLGGLYGCSGGLNVEENNCVFSGH